MKSLHNFETFDADIWPSLDRARSRRYMVAPVPDAHLGEAAAPDLPAAAGYMILAAYGLMMGAFLLFFTGGVEATMMVIISTLYTVIYLAVPATFLHVEARSGGRTMDDFINRGLESWTGHIAGREALLQILLIPFAIVLAIIAIGIVAAIIL